MSCAWCLRLLELRKAARLGRDLILQKYIIYSLVHKITVKPSFDEDGFRLEICLINFIQITKELRMEFSESTLPPVCCVKNKGVGVGTAD